MAKVEDTIKALRCQSTAQAKCEREACPYWRRLSDEEVAAFRKSLGSSYVPEDYLNTCDAERCFMEAADTLERMRWIPVEDETPPAGEVVFVSMGNMLAAGWYVGPDEWFNILSQKVEDVAWTHWMHIPDGPEETSDANHD